MTTACTSKPWSRRIWMHTEESTPPESATRTLSCSSKVPKLLPQQISSVMRKTPFMLFQRYRKKPAARPRAKAHGRAAVHSFLRRGKGNSCLTGTGVTILLQLADDRLGVHALAAVVVGQGGLHRLLGQHAAMHLDRGQAVQRLDHRLVRQLQRLVDRSCP